MQVIYHAWMVLGIDTKDSGSEHVSPASNIAISLWKFKQQKSLNKCPKQPSFFQPRRFPLCWKEDSGRWTSPSHTFIKAFTHLEATILGTTVGWKLYHESCVPLAEKKVCWESWDIYQPTKQAFYTPEPKPKGFIHTFYTCDFFLVCGFTPLPTQANKLHIRKILEGFMIHGCCLDFKGCCFVPKPSKNLRFHQSMLIRYPSGWK